MKYYKKLICFCTVFLMLSSLISCDNKKSNTALSNSEILVSSLSDADNTGNKSSNPNMITTYYDKTTLEGTEDFSEIFRIKSSGDKLYVLGHKDSQINYSLFSTDLNTMETATEQNDIKNSDTTEIKEVYTDKNDNTYEFSYGVLKVYDKENNLIKTIDNKSFDEYEEVTNLFFYSSDVSENGDIYIAASLNTPETIQIIKLNSSFEVEYITDKGIFSDCGIDIQKLFIGKNGNPVLCTQDDNTSYINEISAESGRTLLRYDIPVTDKILGQYGNYDIIYKSENTIYGYDHQNDNTSELYSSDSNASAIMDAYIKDNLLITEQTKTGEKTNVLSIYSKDGKLEKSIDISESGQICDMCIANDGTVLLLSEHYEPFDSGDGETQTTQPLVLRLNEDGSTETKYTGEICNGGLHHLFNVDSQGNMCICLSYSADDMIHATYVTSSGEKTDITYEFSTSPNVSDLMCINDELYFQCHETDYTPMLHLNKETHTIESAGNLTFPASFSTAGSMENDIYYLSGDVISGYNLADGSSQKIFSWFESDAEYILYNLKNFLIADQDNIFYIDDSDKHSNTTQGSASLIHLKKADKERLEELNSRNIITLAGMSIDNDSFNRIKKFNENNSDYMIMATDYSQYNSVLSYDHSEGYRRLLADISDGNIPDIILNDYSCDIQELLCKTELADLNDLVKKDAEIDISDLAENILDAFTYNGKLLYIPCGFISTTFVLPEECTENNASITFDELFSLADKFSDKSLTNTYREYFSEALLSSYISDNVDYTNLTCNFETDIFRKTLEKLKECVPYDVVGSDENNSVNIRSDQCLLRKIDIEDLNSLLYDLIDNKSDYISYCVKGIPSSAGITSLMDIQSSICITNSSENKEGAWEFIKYITDIKDENGTGTGEFESPLSLFRSKNEEEVNLIISRISRSNSSYSPSDIVKISTALNTVCNGKMIFNRRNSKIYNIIYEEANKFFSDEASLDETVSAVQSNADLYLSQLK